jgi:alpha-L-fucosidase
VPLEVSVSVFGPYAVVDGPNHVIAPDKLITLLADIVSNNGNLLLNVGPKPDGTISDIQINRLNKLGEWLSVNGEGIFGFRPRVRSSASSTDGSDVRFTRKGDAVCALSLPQANHLTLPAVYAREQTDLRLGDEGKRRLHAAGPDLKVTIDGAVPQKHTPTEKITPTPWQVVRD